MFTGVCVFMFEYHRIVSDEEAKYIGDLDYFTLVGRWFIGRTEKGVYMLLEVVNV